LEITRAEIEDNRHLPKLRSFLERIMCAKVAGNSVASSYDVAQDFYAAVDIVKAAVRDNLYRGELDDLPADRKIKPSWPPAPELILDSE
jgi:hypothetical protein